MVRFAWLAIFPVLVVCCALGQGGKEPKAPLVVTQKDVDRVICVKSGDVLEIRLPALVPLVWVLDADQPVLRAVKGVPETKPTAQPPAEAEPPIVGAGGHTTLRYEVSTDRVQTIQPEWMYCRFANLDMTRKRLQDGVIPPPPKFSPDIQRADLREGMTFRIQLEVHP